MTSTHKPSAPRPQGPVDPRIYRRIFEQDQDGAAILDELWRVFAKGAVCEGVEPAGGDVLAGGMGVGRR